MTLRFVLAIPALFLTQPALAQTAETPAASEVKVALDTSAGRIVLALDPVHAPVTTANFLKYVDGGRLNGESFYRAMKFGDGGLIQAGVTSNARKLLPPIKHEPVSETGIKHVAGTVAMANLGPGTARADFFILTTDAPSFDNTFATFGKVVEGMDVAKTILASPVSATKGEGIMRGQMLDPVVKITKASRLAN
jgi:peptidyl-prolyl cis-trans isomerase A (cyclophilin A)